MKKLRVFLLAMAFISGLAAQAYAAEPVDPQVVGDETVFAGDEPIMFGGSTCTAPDGNIVYEKESGVSFSPGLYGASFFSFYFMHEDVCIDDIDACIPDAGTASNFDECEFATTDAPAITVTFDVPVTRVGFNGRSPAGEIIVTVFRVGQASDPITLPPIDTTGQMKFIGIVDSEGIDAIEISGTGQVYGLENVFFIDKLRFGGASDTGPKEPSVETVDIDIKPPNCLPAPINMKSKGVTPVVIAGSEDFDVTMIDPDSIELNGVAPERSDIEDVPYCNNSQSDGDGYWDLTLKFDTTELVDAMKGSLTEGSSSEIILKLTGNLLDGTPIEGEDMVSVKGKPQHDWGHHNGLKNHQ